MKNKLKNYLKLGILLFGILILLTNCEEEVVLVEDISKQDNSFVFENLLQSAKIKKQSYNDRASTNSASRSDDASFEATYGTPRFDKTINFINDQGKPILVIPLVDTNDEIINILIGYEDQSIEQFRVISESSGDGSIIYVNTSSSDSSLCESTRLGDKLIGGIFNSAESLLDDSSSTTMRMDLATLPDGCYEVVACDCEGGWGLNEIDCDSLGGGGSGSGSGTGSGSGGGGGSGGGSGTGNDGDTGGDSDTSDDELCGVEVFEYIMNDVDIVNCEELTKLTSNPPAGTTNPYITGNHKSPRIAIINIDDNLNNNWEHGFALFNRGNFPEYGPYAHHTEGSSGNHVNFPGYIYQFGTIHIHQDDGNVIPMFSHDDIYTLLRIRNDYGLGSQLLTNSNTAGDNLFVSILVVKQNEATITYAIKIDDINKLQGLEAKHQNKKEWREFRSKLLDEYTDEAGGVNGTANEYQKVFLNFMKDLDLGVSLYKMRPNDMNNPSQLETWSKLTLSSDGTVIVTTPCNN